MKNMSCAHLDLEKKLLMNNVFGTSQGEVNAGVQLRSLGSK